MEQVPQREVRIEGAGFPVCDEDYEVCKSDFLLQTRCIKKTSKRRTVVTDPNKFSPSAGR